ncbi:hypothetical protein COT42_08060 [Candidatus Saganbacteria bacterium CG08_land_8_20_14_0_20_45_16]|uniref:Uncharacterized protein n=1 Tax=Candidatus Saganbacteria bacterium CG08_land_8_20_14_0_20_45_16 TaxID=2014293 RepID=A0A2H0XUA5_UNCSA|nr:MAG: hypothetical protein COT42_08060 [Candidatus Saganbacteria bacterium CG08_land_8_20_14_0_20_45_16]
MKMQSNYKTLKASGQLMSGVARALREAGLLSHMINKGPVRQIHAPDIRAVTNIINWLRNAEDVAPELIPIMLNLALPIATDFFMIDLGNGKYDLVVAPRNRGQEIQQLRETEEQRGHTPITQTSLLQLLFVE